VVNAQAVTAGAPGTNPVWHALTVADVLNLQAVDAEAGLADDEVARRRERLGSNRFAEVKPERRWRAFLRQYRDLMQIVLLAAAIASFWPVKEYGTGLVLIVITVFNALLGMQQEGKAAAAVAALSKMMIVKAKVRRAGTLRELPAEELVPGAVVAIETGYLVPADGRIIAAATLEIDESALTGESVPVPKETDAVTAFDTPLADRVDMAYMNTSVTRGSATVVVTATGMDSEVGHISGPLQGQKQTKTPLTRQLDTLTTQILTIAGVALVASLGMNLARGRTLKKVFAASIAVLDYSTYS
jgi:Ca2+-transporting ATPase